MQLIMRKLLFLPMFLVCIGGLFTSCSMTRYVPEDSCLLNRVRLSVEGEDNDINTSQIRNYLRQRPNARWFTLVRLPLATYSMSGTDSTRWINRLLKDMGEAPVLYDSMLTVMTCENLRQQLRNEGYLQAEVSFRTRQHGRKMDVEYVLRPGKPYFIRSVKYDYADEQIAQMLRQMADSTHSLLAEGMKFDASKLDAERKRITDVLADQGYFRFHKEYISYTADTTKGSKMIDVTLHLHPFRQKDQGDSLHTRYVIGNIRYASGDVADSSIHLRKRVLEECTHLESGKSYSASKLQQTYNHFGRMQAVRYTNISFTNQPNTNILDCDIQLQNNKPSTISFQPEGTNTAGDLGAAASLTYQNRNLFRGSELLSIELRGAYEAIRGLEGYSQQDFIEYSVGTRLAFPRFIVPFISRDIRRKLNASSEVSLLYDLQNRPEYHRQVLSAAWRYKWNFPNRRDRFQLDLLDLNYIFMPWISSTFRKEYLDSENSRNAILRYNYEDLFITKIGFGYSYSNRSVAVKMNVETSGNLLSLGARVFKTEKDENGHYRLFNIAFAQYAKADIDLTRSFQIDPNNQFVLHAGFGIAYPYGNSNVLPFEKRYFSGGANSVRGWSVRSLGPGTYKEKDGRINFINQTGDMKLDLNAEYRTHLFWKLGGALFVDAGNVWTLRDYDIQPGGEFHFEKFLSQLAVSYGLGIRLNFDYFILRFDLGMKAVNPSYKTEGEEHFPIIHPKFTRDYAFHFAVGLPF